MINYSTQHAASGGTNVTVASGSPPGPVAVSGTRGSAIGSQTASGEDSTVTGSQSVQGGHDAAISGGGDQPVKEGWWARLRRRAVVAFSRIIGALAGVAGVDVAIMVAAG